MCRSLPRRNHITPALAALLCLIAPAVSIAQSAANPGIVEENNLARYRQICAISDVHGMYDHLSSLLIAARMIDRQGNWTAGNTLLVVTGDSIDKGPASIKVIDLWRKLQPLAEQKGGRLIVLLGNHEAEFLANPNAKKSLVFRNELSKLHLDPNIIAKGDDAEGRGNFLLRLPIAAKVGEYLFSHAGWYPKGMNWTEFAAKSKALLQSAAYSDALVTGPHSILEEKNETTADGDDVKWYDDPGSVKNLEKRISDQGLFGIVFGHQPHAFGFMKQIGAVDGLRIIKINSGMAPADAGGDESAGELLRFPYPTELLQPRAPTAERVTAHGEATRL